MKHDKRITKTIATMISISVCATMLVACTGGCDTKPEETIEITIESINPSESVVTEATPTVTVKPTVTPKPTATVTPTTAVTENGNEGTEATATATATPTTAETKPTAAAPTEAPATQPAATEAPAPTEAPATQPAATEAPAAQPTATPEPTAEPTPEPTEAPTDPWETATYCTVDVNVRVGVSSDEQFFTLYGYTAKRVGNGNSWMLTDEEYDRLDVDIWNYAQAQGWSCGSYAETCVNHRDPRTEP